MHKTADLTGAGRVSYESSSDRMSFSEKLFESSRPPRSYGRMSQHAFMPWVHSRINGVEYLNLASYRTQWDPAFNSGIPDQGKKQRREEAAR